jgi:tRNA(Ile)-lysidine synthase
MDFFNKSEQAILLAAKNIIVGYSGGADSTLALFATNEFLKSHDQASKLTALHIDHQMQANSTAWLKHCEAFCGKHNIAFKCQKAEIKQSGQGFEAAARSARQIIFNTYDKNSVIIMGHHMDDQVETVFFSNPQRHRP